MKKIELDLFYLRPLQVSDGGALLNLVNINRLRIRPYLPKTESAIVDKASVKKYIREKIKNASEMREFCFIIEEKDTHILCGAIFLKNFEWTVPKCELGYFINKDHEGKGITSKAIKALSRYCFIELKLNKLFIRSATDNAGSRKVAENCGFIKEGLLRKDFMTDKGELIDVVYYGLVKE